MVVKTYEDFRAWKETPEGQAAPNHPLSETMKNFDEVETEAVRIFGQALIEQKGERAAWEAAESFLRERGRIG